MLSRFLKKMAKAFDSWARRVESKTIVPVETQVAPEDKRRFDRYIVPYRGLMRVKFLRTGRTFPVYDISYGGLAFVDPSRMPKIASATPELVELTVLERTVRTKLSILNMRGEVTACLFHHEDSETLIFLRESLEGFRKGSSVRTVPEEILQDKYRDGNWVYMRGAGPTDILISCDKAGKLLSVLITIQVEDRYAEVRFHEGRLETGKSMDREGSPATRMGTTAKLDPILLHQVACILMCVNQPEAEAPVADLLGMITKELGVKEEIAAATERAA